MRNKVQNILLIVLFILIFCRISLQSQIDSSRANYFGEIRYHWLHSDVVKDDYFIRIYLPEKYEEEEQRKYPVIYMTDGDRYFGLVTDFVYSLLHREDIKVIVVGIGYGTKNINNLKRRRDYKTNPDSDKPIGSIAFRNFIEKELFPQIEFEYPIDKTDRTLIGWSLGGTFTLNTMFNNPLLFKNYLVLSGRLNYEEDPLLEVEREYSERNSDLQARLFYSMGNKDERYEQFPGFVKNLKSRNYQSLKFETYELEGKTHDIVAMSEGLGLGLQSIFIRKNINEKLLETLNTKGIEAAIEVYHKMREEQYEEYDFRERRLNDLGYFLLEQDRVVESIEIFKLNTEIYPKSYNVYDSLGESYWLHKNYEMALRNYKKSLELNPKNENASKMIRKINAEK